MLWLVMSASGSCQLLPGVSSASSGLFAINQPVGRRRGWFNEPFIAPLKAEQRLASADSYATFAQECLADKPDKPPFVESRPGGLAGAR